MFGGNGSSHHNKFTYHIVWHVYSGATLLVGKSGSLLGVLLVLSIAAAAQNTVTENSTAKKSADVREARKRSVPAMRAEQAPVIDGVLDDDCWINAPIAEGFTTTAPQPDKPSRLLTQIRILYDDDALYIGAHMHDPHPDSIQVTLSRRDEKSNADWMGVLICPYMDGTNALGFSVTAAGVQIDDKWTGFNTDVLWDAVWESAVSIDEKGWYAELAIPYGALRFKSADVQDWGINIFRHLRRYREDSWWSPVDVAEEGFIQQVGTLEGLENIHAPLRISLTPYVSSFVELRSDPQNNITEAVWDLNGGMDLKYGINDGFTLDMTLIPDFNQVRFDNEVLNLSPFEVRFNENRAFFTEGTELFNKKEELFYSRRVGGRPLGFFEVGQQLQEGEEIISNPVESRLFNAFKVSGRTDAGLGIGLFNAITGQTEALIRNQEGEERSVLTSPLSNYQVFVLDQNLGRDNSFVSLINTNVWRAGSWRDAQVSSLVVQLRDRSERYQLRTEGALSQLFDDGWNRPELGHTAGARLDKVSGQSRFVLGYYEESDTYNPNDMGFLLANNERVWYGVYRYDVFKPFWKINQLYNSVEYYYQRIYLPNAFASTGITLDMTQVWSNFLYTGFWAYTEPITTYDYFEPRSPGRYLEYPINRSGGAWFSTDYRKKLALDMRGGYRWFDMEDRREINYRISPRWRVNDKVLLILTYSRTELPSDLGWVNSLSDGSIIMGKRDLLISETGFQGNYIFNNNMFLSVIVRHYWSAAEYLNYYELGEDGKIYPTDYDGIRADNEESAHNVNFNAFTVDAAFTWRYAPGSDLILVWKEGIFNSTNVPQSNYLNNIERTFQSPQSNNVSLRLVYYLDYVLIRKWWRNSAEARATRNSAAESFHPQTMRSINRAFDPASSGFSHPSHRRAAIPLHP